MLLDICYPKGYLLTDRSMSCTVANVSPKSRSHMLVVCCVVNYVGELFSRAMQGPTHALRLMCNAVSAHIRARELLIFFEDVWPEDFPLLGSQWLALDRLCKSACIITSRDLGNSCSNYRTIKMQRLPDALAQELLFKHTCAPDHLADERAAQDVRVRCTTCISLREQLATMQERFSHPRCCVFRHLFCM